MITFSFKSELSKLLNPHPPVWMVGMKRRNYGDNHRGYSRTIKWHHPDGTVNSVTSCGHKSFKEATKSVVELASRHGWRPRKWWELWRLEDVQPTKSELEALNV